MSFNLNLSKVSILLDDWLKAEKVVTKEDSLIECQYQCTRSDNCTAATYMNKTCAMAKVSIFKEPKFKINKYFLNPVCKQILIF